MNAGCVCRKNTIHTKLITVQKYVDSAKCFVILAVYVVLEYYI